jgi:hypothetical protein
MAMVPPGGLKAAGLLPEAKERSAEIEKFEPGWEKEWFRLRPEPWGFRTHKVYHPKWKAPEGAKLSLEVRSAEAGTMAVGIDGYGVEVDLVGGGEWQKVVLAPEDFRGPLGDRLADWEGIRELRLMAQDSLRARKDGKSVSLRLGAKEPGKVPEFRQLRWE